MEPAHCCNHHPIIIDRHPVKEKTEKKRNRKRNCHCQVLCAYNIYYQYTEQIEQQIFTHKRRGIQLILTRGNIRYIMSRKKKKKKKKVKHHATDASAIDDS